MAKLTADVKGASEKDQQETRERGNCVQTVSPGDSSAVTPPMLITYTSWDARHKHVVLTAPSPPKRGPAAAGCADSFAWAFFRSVRMAAQPYVSCVCSAQFHNSVMSPKHPQPGSFPLKWDPKDEMQERRWAKPPPSQFPASPRRILSAVTIGT